MKSLLEEGRKDDDSWVQVIAELIWEFPDTGSFNMSNRGNEAGNNVHDVARISV